uniref:ATP synthase complex subunit 8 n=1 Tax=Sarophorus sp. SAR01 TaxID=1205578 RepID=A0A0S2MND8_9SCAR|nr:ATP synthase F0 subunit 8 [Sarophorus sp. SAR01]
MPQMAPLNWLMLFLMFCMTFMLFNSLNYYSFNYNIKSYSKKKMTYKINWKW